MKIIGYIGLIIVLFMPLFVVDVHAGVIPQTNWRLWYVDSEETVGENGAAENAFDGNPATIWHTQWSGPPPPHEIQIDLRGTYSIDGFRYLPRQTGINGRIGQYEFYVSSDGFTWGSPVATGTFANTAAEQEIHFAAKTGQYVRLRAMTEVNGNPWTSVAEINVLESGSSGNQAPNGVIDAPVQNMTINVGDSVSFSGTGSDPDNNLPLSFRWSFGTGSGIPDSTVEDPGLKQFNTPGIYTVTFTATDALGLSDPTPATRVITVLGGTGGGVIPQTNWQLWYVDSEETVGENGAAENAFDGNPATIWHTQWSGPPPPHEIQIDLRGTYSIDGFRYLPRQTGINGRIGQYEFYVSSDGFTWGSPVATGTFANTAAEQEIHFAAKTGQYVRLRAMTEVNGNPWTSVAEINVLAANLEAGDEYIAIGDSITLGESDDYPFDDKSFDGRNIGGGFEPILNDLLTAAKGFPHSIVNEGVSGATSLDGLLRLPTVMANHPNARYYLILYGTNDANIFVDTPSGLGLNPGQAGYNGSYKDNLQQIISEIRLGGKTPYLAKVPYTLDAVRIPKILQYNAVIDELVASNGIAVVPPDFYAYFSAHQDEFAEPLHPNGVGYQSMANLWFNALSN